MKTLSRIPNLPYLIYIALFCVVGVAAYYYCFDSKIFLGGDNIYYYNLGKALAEGKGYVTLNEPGTPPATHYPPGYPAIISLAMLLVSQKIVVIKMVNGVFMLGSAIGCFYLFDKLSSNAHLVFVSVLLMVLNAEILEGSTIMMSEIPFLFFTLLALIFFIKTKTHTSLFKQPTFYGFVLCLAISCYIRTIGIALAAGFIAYLFLRKEWRYLFSATSGFLVLMLPWTIRNYLLGSNSYIQAFLAANPYRPELGTIGWSDLVYRIAENFQRYLTTEIPYGLFPFLRNELSSFPIMNWILGIVVILLIMYGLYHLQSHSQLIGLYLVFYFGILLLWPSVWYGSRFILPVLPLLLFLCLFGLHQLISAVAGSIKNTVIEWHPLYLLVIMIFFIPGLQGLHVEAGLPYLPNWREYISVAKWAQEHTPEEAVISCRKPAIFYLFSERKTVRFKESLDSAELIQDFEKNGVDYVVVEQLGFSATLRYLKPAIHKYDHRFTPLPEATFETSYMLKFKPDS